jgi:hypothetical protein
MHPKRTADAESSESPRKRAKKTAASSQRNIESFFSKGKEAKKKTSLTNPGSPIPHSQPASTSKLRPGLIIIDDSEEDDDSGLAPGPAPLKAGAATPVLTGIHSVPDVGLTSSLVSSEIADDIDSLRALSNSIIKKRPGGPTILNSVQLVKHVTGAKDIPSIISDVSRVSHRRPTIEKPRERGLAPEASGPLDLSAILPFPDFTTDPLLFDPCVDSGHSPWWPQGTPAPYALLVHALQALTSTRSRIAILSIVTNVLRVLLIHDPSSVLSALYLLSNSLSPPWEGIELGAGGSVISKVRFFSFEYVYRITGVYTFGHVGAAKYHIYYSSHYACVVQATR